MRSCFKHQKKTLQERILSDTRAHKKFRSQEWCDNPNNPGMTSLYLERYQNQEYTREELQAERPVIGIAQTGSDIALCNKIHVFLMDRIKAGIGMVAAFRWNFPCTRSRKPASARRPRWTET